MACLHEISLIGCVWDGNHFRLCRHSYYFEADVDLFLGIHRWKDRTSLAELRCDLKSILAVLMDVSTASFWVHAMDFLLVEYRVWILWLIDYIEFHVLTLSYQYSCVSESWNLLHTWLILTNLVDRYFLSVILIVKRNFAWIKNELIYTTEGTENLQRFSNFLQFKDSPYSGKPTVCGSYGWNTWTRFSVWVLLPEILFELIFHTSAGAVLSDV